MDDYIGIVAICGEEGTSKTTMGLTFPKPLRHYDIDVGGFRRAIWRLKPDGIVSRSYPKPLQMEKLIGAVSTRLAAPKKVEGVKELWQRIAQDFVTDCQDESVRTVVLDSATLFWNICHNSHLQELQERQLAIHRSEFPNKPFDESRYRERLQPIEYGPANDRARTVLHTARSYQKNLVLIHYPTDEYGTDVDDKGRKVEVKTGRKIMDGFKETAKLADLVVWISIKNIDKVDTPMAKITKCGLEGLGLVAVGLEIEATYEGIRNLQKTMRGE